MCITGPYEEVANLILKTWKELPFGDNIPKDGKELGERLKIFWDWIECKEIKNMVELIIKLKLGFIPNKRR